MNIIITHKHGDFDALASLIAAARLYPGSRIIMPEPTQPNVRSFINLYRDLLPLSDPKDVTEDPETAVVVDTARVERLGDWADVINKAKIITVYDHHPLSGDDIRGNNNRVEEVGATTTLLLEEIQQKQIRLTQFESTLMALGIYEDTGCLTYEPTTARDAAAIAYLWDQGLSIKVLQDYLRPALSESQKHLLEALIKNLKLYEINQRKVLISCTVMSDYVQGAAVILQLLDEIEGANLSFIIVEMDDSIYMAVRTSDNDIDLTEFLRPFNVKGHPSVVSANFKAKSPEELEKQLLEFLNAYLPPATMAGAVASKPVFVLEDKVTSGDALALLAGKGLKGCPVVENGELVGIISERDLQKALRSNLSHAPVKGFMNRKVITASPGDSLPRLRELMVEHNIGRIPLLDGQGNLAGIVTRSDILRHLNALDQRGRLIGKKNGEESFGERLDLSSPNNILELINRELSTRMQGLLLLIGNHAARTESSIYLVGGVIRDLFLGRPLPRDLDFVVVGNAVSFAQELQKHLGGKLKLFEQFGTATLFLKDGLRLDMVTARREFYASPAALPQVEKSSLKSDLYRRDFSINTMACSLMKNNYGELYDFFGGRSDIEQNIIRVLYKLSFVDDPLRILRAVRFEQRYRFSIEPETAGLLRNAVEKKVLDKVSRQRLAQELKLIYNEPEPLLILKRYEDLGLLKLIFPKVRPGQFFWKRLGEIDSILKWSFERQWEKHPDPEQAYLCGILYDLESGDRSAIIRKLQLSREAAEHILNSCSSAPGIMEKLKTSHLYPSELAILLGPLPLEGLLLIYALTESAIKRSYLKLYMNNLRHLRPSLNGTDLKEMGLEPGPLFSEILEKLKEAIMDGAVNSPQEEINFVVSYLKKENGK